MDTFIKAGLWITKKEGRVGEFNLTQFIKKLISSTPQPPPVLPYKVYTALLTQIAGVVTSNILENTLGTLTFVYDSITNNITITSSSLFTTNKTCLFFGPVPIAYYGDTTAARIDDNNTIRMKGDATTTQNMLIEIRVYN